MVLTACSTRWRCAMQLRRQFNNVADRIGRPAGKRAWLLYAASPATRSNAPPTMGDIGRGDIASPSRLLRSRPRASIRNPLWEAGRELPLRVSGGSMVDRQYASRRRGQHLMRL